MTPIAPRMPVPWGRHSNMILSLPRRTVLRPPGYLYNTTSDVRMRRMYSGHCNCGRFYVYLLLRVRMRVIRDLTRRSQTSDSPTTQSSVRGMRRSAKVKAPRSELAERARAVWASRFAPVVQAFACSTFSSSVPFSPSTSSPRLAFAPSHPPASSLLPRHAFRRPRSSRQRLVQPL